MRKKWRYVLICLVVLWICNKLFLIFTYKTYPDEHIAAMFEPITSKYEIKIGYEIGDDFFSPALMEADLMRRVLPRSEFLDWLRRFLPGLSRGQPENLMTPAIVADRSDPKIVHLDGLNLSRAWCMAGIATALQEGSRSRTALEKAARLHAADAMANITSGHYEGEHWLASFAVFTLSSFEDL